MPLTFSEIKPSDRSLLNAIREAGLRLTGQVKPMEAGLETPIFTEPIRDYLTNPPEGTSFPVRAISGALGGFVPGTRGEVIGTLADLAAGGRGLGASFGEGVTGKALGIIGRGSKGGVWQKAPRVLREPTSIFNTPEREAAFMRAVLRGKGRARQIQPPETAIVDVLSPWGYGGRTAEVPFSSWLRSQGLAGTMHEAAARAGIGPTDEDQQRWARRLRETLEGESYGGGIQGSY